MTKAIIIVDVQHDFLPGGALGVSHGDKVIPVIQDKVKDFRGLVVTTQDWHPKDTAHFAKWPVHCVAETHGALLHPDIQAIRGVRIFKGGGIKDDGYSGFEGTDVEGRSLEDVLRQNRVREVEVVGLALDYCVKATALDAAENGYEVTVPLSATRAVDPQRESEVIDELRDAGVNIEH